MTYVCDMINRIAKARLKKLAASFRSVAVVGPRQSGKTTLCRLVFPKKPYVSLENPDVREFAKTDPRGFLGQFKNGAILDEVQKVPELFSYLQQVLDETSKKGLFILTGSNNFLLQENITQTLAGRIAYLQLLPLSMQELKVDGLLAKDYHTQILKGGYPEIYNNKKLNAKDWFPNYLNTYIERDVRQLRNINNLQLFNKFLRLCAGRVGQILNMTSISNDCGVDQKTIAGWLGILESSYVVYLLRPYFNNLNKRVLKSPKIYFYDTGVAASLLGIESTKQLTTHAMLGGLFENLMVNELLKERLNKGMQDNLYYWRDKTGNEVNMLIDDAGKLIAIEMKAGQTINPDYFKGLNYVQAVYPKLKTRIVCYGGKLVQKRSNDVLVKPWNELV
jgi:uncharacterized protein